MNISHIKSLVATGETNTVEFKKSTAQLHGAVETLCAFLNGTGGIVLLGVNQDGKLLGQDVTDNTQQEIAKELNKIEPFAAIEINYVALGNNKKVIVMQAEKGKHIPYIYDGRAYQRNQSATMRMTQHHYEQLLLERGQLNSWEELTAKECDINDLDHGEIRKAVSDGITVGRIDAGVQSKSIEEILLGWKLMQENKINNAAVVLFAKQDMLRYPQCRIKLGRFIGKGERRDLVDSKDFSGNAFYLLSQANLFMMNHLPIASFFDPNQFQRQDKPALPVLAVREAMVNALCHRDYSKRSGMITLAIYDDRLEIWNSGTLPSELKIKNLKDSHHSIPRNERISKVFYDRKFFEGWGSGITTMLRLCREHDVPAPVFGEDTGGFSITFQFKTPIGAISELSGSPEQIELTVRQKEIIEILTKQGALGTKKIITELTDPPSERMVRKDLNLLKEKGIIELEGNTRTAIWKYKSSV